MFKIVRPRAIAYLAFEGALIFAALWASAQLIAAWSPDVDSVATSPAILGFGVLFSAVLFITQWSNPGETGFLTRELVVFTVFSILTGLVAFGAVWLWSGTGSHALAWVPLAGAFSIPGVVALWRFASSRVALLNPDRESVLIVGTGATAQQVCRHISEGHGNHYAIIGFADEEPSRVGSVLAMGARIQTDYANLARFALSRADRVIVALDEKRGKLPVRQLMEIRLRGLEIEEATTFFERVSGKISVETMLPSWLIFSDGFRTSPMRRLIKRTLDILFSIILLLVSLPVMLLTAVLIKLDSRGPVFYRQERLGRDGVPFKVVKFRSMRQDAEKASGPVWAKKNDPRITRIGGIIRKCRIDELPQLINVFKGQMSFVGPRPEREHFVRQLEQKIPYYGLRLTVRPGLTGWAQVEYRYAETDEDALEKLKYDLYYIKNNNVLLDLWIVLKTVKVVLVGGGQ